MSAVPVITRAGGVSDESVAASAAEASIFAGRVEWGLEFSELVERCVFASVRNAGFFVIDSRRQSLSHHLDSGEGETAAMFDLIEADAVLQIGGFVRLKLEALDSVPATRWRLLDSADGVITDSIVPSGLSFDSVAGDVCDVINPRLPHVTFTALWKRVVASASGRGLAVIAMVGDVTGIAHFWLFTAENSVADFTVETLGDSLLDGSWGYTATLPV